MALAYRVYDKIPNHPFGTKTAYISFGATDGTDEGADCISALKITTQVDVWSCADGLLEAKNLTDLIRRALHRQSLQLTDNAIVDTEVVLWRVIPAPKDGLAHGLVQVTAIVEEP